MRLAALTATLVLSMAQAATIRIASVSPLSGSLAPIGSEVKRGAELAVQQQQRAFRALGYDLELVAMDDQASASNATPLAKKMMDDPSLLGVVGALNSSVTNVLGGALAPSSLALISPASTNTGLSENGWNNFSRLVAPDSAQAVAAVKYMLEELKARKVFIVSDNTAYGNGLSKTVQVNLKKNNLTLSGYMGASNAQQVSSAVKAIKAASPDVVYYGGTDDNGSQLVKALRGAGVKAVFMGGDGLDSPSFVERAGSAAAGVVYSTGFGPIDPVTGRQYIRLYQAAYKEQASGVSAYAYDSTVVLLEAIKTLLEQGKMPTRAQVSRAVRQVKLDGCRSDLPVCTTISGPVAFDDRGERERSRVYIVTLNSKGVSEITTVKTVTAASLR
ncbi:branched-chain amino acid ABC transporter substrate-binding protein [Deinococcus cavernae]|nr:branched-chain amino acid ABC transporter substrate-binding protein [Deinococcus cavernae]